jgi:hypothetical protein
MIYYYLHKCAQIIPFNPTNVKPGRKTQLQTNMSSRLNTSNTYIFCLWLFKMNIEELLFSGQRKGQHVTYLFLFNCWEIKYICFISKIPLSDITSKSCILSICTYPAIRCAENRGHSIRSIRTIRTDPYSSGFGFATVETG